MVTLTNYIGHFIVRGFLADADVGNSPGATRKALTIRQIDYAGRARKGRLNTYPPAV